MTARYKLRIVRYQVVIVRKKESQNCEMLTQKSLNYDIYNKPKIARIKIVRFF